MSGRNIQSIQVVSPHLDDAAFSLGEFLKRAGFPPRTVFTVITNAADRLRDANEYERRRQEDKKAMDRLRIPFVHCGIHENNLDQPAADNIVRQITKEINLESSVVLLPLGAGGRLTYVKRLARRLSRTPTGCAAHGEHIWVRDRVRERLERTDITIGYYAELPYQWANNTYELERLAQSLSGSQLGRFTLATDANAKLSVAMDYASQLEKEFGRKRSYQLRTASICERIFLPVV